MGAYCGREIERSGSECRKGMRTVLAEQDSGSKPLPKAAAKMFGDCRAHPKWLFADGVPFANVTTLFILPGFPVPFGCPLPLPWLMGRWQTVGLTLKVYKAIGRYDIRYSCSKSFITPRSTAGR